MLPGTSHDEILGAIQAAIQELFEIEAARVIPATRFVEDLDLDSVDALDLVRKLEEQTGRRFAETRLRKLRTVGDVITAIQAVLGAGGARSRRVPA